MDSFTINNGLLGAVRLMRLVPVETLKLSSIGCVLIQVGRVIFLGLNHGANSGIQYYMKTCSQVLYFPLQINM